MYNIKMFGHAHTEINTPTWRRFGCIIGERSCGIDGKKSFNLDQLNGFIVIAGCCYIRHNG